MEEMETLREVSHLLYQLKKENTVVVKNHPGIRHRDVMILDMISIMSEKEPVKMNDISAHFHVTPAAVSQLVKRYEKEGLIKRMIPDDDRRSVYIEISENGRKLLNECETHVKKTLLSFIKKLGDEDAKACIRILEKAVVFSREMHKQERNDDQ